jgi:hypothetical protein
VQTLPELIWEDLNAQLHHIKKNVRFTEIVTERSETAAGHPSSTLAAAPLRVGGAKNGDERFITDGRKVGEGVGAGTGVLCYYDNSTDQWIHPATDTAITI